MASDIFDIFRGFLGLPSGRFSSRDRHIDPDSSSTPVPLDEIDRTDEYRKRPGIFDFFFENEDLSDPRHNPGRLPNVYGDDDEGDYDLSIGGPSTPFGFRIFAGDPMDMSRYFEQQFDDMLRNFQSFMSGSFNIQDDIMTLPDINGPDEVPLRPPNEEHIRDQYLKKPDEPRMLPHKGSWAGKADVDLDDKVNSTNIGALLNSDQTMDHQIPSRSYGQRFSSKTIHLPDGRVEHHKEMKATDGSQTLTVTRKIGDQSYTVTTITDSTGAVQKSQELNNIDEDKLAEFESKWKAGLSLNAPNTPPFHNGSISKLLPSIMDNWFK